MHFCRLILVDVVPSPCTVQAQVLSDALQRIARPTRPIMKHGRAAAGRKSPVCFLAIGVRKLVGSRTGRSARVTRSVSFSPHLEEQHAPHL